MDKTMRPRVTEDEYNLIQYMREKSIEPASMIAEVDESGAHNAIKEIGGNPFNIKRYWYKTKLYSIEVDGSKLDPEAFTYALIEKIKGHEPDYSPIKYTSKKDPHCLVIDPADVHIGKLARMSRSNDEYNSSIAVDRVVQGVDAVLGYASGFQIEKIVLIIGNDIMHVDSTANTTTRGTRQDVDGLWHEMFMIAKELYVRVIERLRLIAPVHVIHNPSNHDFHSGWMLAQVIEAWFAKDKSITFDCGIKNRKYHTYGKSLFGTTHGDGAKAGNLPMLMAQEAKEEWAKSKFRYWYLHHIHHKKGFKYVTVQDEMGVSVEYVRSPSGSDAWHSDNGYVGSPKAIEAFVLSRDNGQVSRLTYNF